MVVVRSKIENNCLLLFCCCYRYKSIMQLNITNVRESDLVTYECVVKNDVDDAKGPITLYSKIIILMCYMCS